MDCAIYFMPSANKYNSSIYSSQRIGHVFLYYRIKLVYIYIIPVRWKSIVWDEIVKNYFKGTFFCHLVTPHFEPPL